MFSIKTGHYGDFFSVIRAATNVSIIQLIKLRFVILIDSLSQLLNF